MTIDLNPDLFGLHFTTLFTLIGGVAGVAWLLRESRWFGLARRATYGVAVKAVFWAVLGGRLLHLIDYAGFYVDVPFQAFYLWNGGLSAWGAVLGGGAGAWWHARRAGADVAQFADRLVLAGLAMLAMGRLGDLLAGERIGDATSLPWAVVYADPRATAFGFGAMHPIALYEAALVAAIATGVWWLGRRTVGLAMPAALAGYAAVRFVVGFATVQRTHMGLDLAQWVSVAVLAALAWWLWRERDVILARDLRKWELPR